MSDCIKKCFRSRKEAKDFIKNHKKLKGNAVYYCRECSYWHLTSMPKEQSRNITRKLSKLK